ncbi:hypothetical protein KEM55_008130 [Ascosphaera atra]|nr:hypothetical protein KEM55_008130 [Ascosphaera atra]
MMSLVTYSDSDSSDVEETPSVPAAKPAEQPKKPTSGQPQKLVDRRNPRRILVNLSDKGKADTDSAIANAGQDGPARKKPRIGGGGGLFSGFNDLLPTPKERVKPRFGSGAVSTSKPFSLKTGAEPSFKRDEPLSMGEPTDSANSPAAESIPPPKKSEEVQVKGNAMMFKPLSVARNSQKKRKVLPSRPAVTGQSQVETTETKKVESKPPEAAPKKPKVSLFGMPHETEQLISESAPAIEEDVTTEDRSGAASLISEQIDPSAMTANPYEAPHTTATTSTTTSTVNQSQPQSQSLASVASDLNLSKSEMRQLFGRQAGKSGANIPTLQDANIRHFNIDEEYKANAAYLANATEQELAAQQHNPVRAIAPGKHSLQQLVNSVHNQRDALEESFAAGKRNKKEAGSKYGW